MSAKPNTEPDDPTRTQTPPAGEHPDAGSPPPAAKQAGKPPARKADEKAVAASLPLPCLNGIHGAAVRPMANKEKGLEPFTTTAEAERYKLRNSVDGVVFAYQHAFVVVERWHTKHIALGRGRQPFRTATEAHHTIRLNPRFGSARYTVLPYGDGFAIVPADMEQTLRRCYPSFVAFHISEGGANDPSTIAANSSGHRIVLARGKKVSAPFDLFSTLRDARGAMVDPNPDARANQPAYVVRGMASKVPMQVVGAIAQAEHQATAEAGRSLRDLQMEREAQKMVARPDTGVSMLDGGEDDPDVTVGL